MTKRKVNDAVLLLFGLRYWPNVPYWANKANKKIAYRLLKL